MIKHKVFQLLIVTAALTLGSGPALAAIAGKILMAKGVVTATDANGEARFLARESEVHEGEQVNTGDKSFAVISFTDSTRTTLRPNTELVIETYSHGDATKEDKASFNLVSGGLRAVSGLIGKKNPDSFRINTLAASMGIRGTAWDIRVCADGDTSCEDDDKALSAGKPKALANLAESKCLDTIDLEGQPPGTYFAVYEGKIFVIKNDEELELVEGSAGYAGRSGFGCLSTFPTFLIGDPIVFPDQLDNLNPGFLELMCQ